MKKMNFRFLLCICLGLFFLTSCEDEPDVVVTPKRTVLVYMAADNSLSRFAVSDLAEMREGLMSTNGELCLLVYVDTGSSQFSPRLIELRKKSGTVVETVVQEYGDRNSVGAEETREVFNDVFNNPDFKAESYGLVYWSHGEGWIPYSLPSSRWIGQDTGNGTYYMNLSELKYILDIAPHFDFIMFDACFMQSIEVMYELREYADYFIASPTETPGPGAPYDWIVPYMASENAASEMVKAYYNAYNKYYTGNTSSGTSTETWTMGCSICSFSAAMLERLAMLTNQYLSQSSVDTEILRTEIFNYDKRNPKSSSFIGYYDWVEMMQMLLGEMEFNVWKQVFDESVIYYTTPVNYSAMLEVNNGLFSMEGTNGVTHYIPNDNENQVVAYRSTSWYQDAGLAKLGW